MKETLIKDFHGRILGRIQTDENGDKTVKDFHGRVLGRYKKTQNVTTDFYGRIIARGDASASLIPSEINY